MFPLPSFRKSSPLIKPLLANQRFNIVRPVFSQSQDFGSSSLSLLKPSFGGSGSGDKKSGEGLLLLLLLRSISSGVLIVGSSLGFCYLSHSFDRNSLVSFADAPNEAIDGDAQFEHAIPQKKSKFLFGGNLGKLMKHQLSIICYCISTFFYIKCWKLSAFFFL